MSKSLIVLAIILLISGCNNDTETNQSANNEIKYQISTVTNDGGVISPTVISISNTSTASFEITPLDGFKIDSVEGCSGVLSDSIYTVSQINDDCEINVTFIAMKYTVSSTVSTGGSLTPTEIKVAKGEKTTFDVLADTGYAVQNISGCNGSFHNNQYTTDKITTNCNISVTFSEDNLAPSANILFPWKTSRTNDEYIIVKGTAQDNSEIVKITVNGISATISSTKIVEPNSSAQQISWQAKVNAKQATTTLNISTEDVLGNINSNADSATVYNYQIPMNFTIDQKNEFLFGSNEHNSLVKIHLPTKEVETLTTDFPNNNTYFDVNTKFAYVEDINALLYVSIFDQLLSINQIDVATGAISTLFNQSFETFVFFNSLDYINVDNSILINLNLVGDNTSKILKFSLDNQELTTLVDSYTQTNQKINTQDIAYTPNGFIGFSESGLFNLTLDGSNYSPFSSNFYTFMTNIEADINNSYLYTAGPYGIFKFNVNTQVKEAEFLNEDAPDFHFGQIRSIAHYQASDLLLVGDSDLDTIVAVNTQNGSRTGFISNGIGEGKTIVEARALALDEENNQLYIFDGGYDNGEVVISVDLATGNRTVVSDIDKHINRGVWVRDIVLDKPANKLYLSSEDAIISVDLQTEQSFILSDVNTGTGEVIGFIGNTVLDKDNNRLIVTDTSSENLIAVDLTTGNRSVIADISNIANGQDLGIFYLAYDKETKLAFILSRELGELYQINLNNMEQTLLLNQCLDTTQTNHLLGSSSNHIQLHLNTKTRQLLMTSEGFLKFDIDQNTCTASKSRRTSFDALLTDKNQIIATGNNRIIQQDFASGEQVIISK